MAVEPFSVRYFSARNIYFRFINPSNGEVFDFDDTTWKANLAACTNAKLVAIEDATLGDADESFYRANLDLSTFYTGIAQRAFVVQALEDLVADVIISEATLYVQAGTTAPTAVAISGGAAPLAAPAGFGTVDDYLGAMRFELEEVSGHNYTNEELYSYLNEAVDTLWKELIAQAPWYFDSTNYLRDADYVVTSGIPGYGLPDDFAQLRLLDINGDEGENLKLKAEVDEDAEGFLLQQNQIKLFPTPDEDGDMTLYYVPRPQVIDSGGHAVPLSEDFAQTLKEYCVLKGRVRNNENVGGVEAFYRLVRSAVSRFAVDRNAPYDRGWKLPAHRYI